MNPDELRRLIEETADEEGRITCEGVVAAAANPDHPLHDDPGFCWDDEAEAARRHRLAYAGRLIRRVYCVIRPVARRQARVPYFVRDPRTREHEPGYVPLESVRPNPQNARVVAVDELRRVVGILQRTSVVVGTLGIEGVGNDLAHLLAGARILLAQLTPPVVMPSAAQET